MSSIINATTTNGVVIQPDNSGSLVLQTNNGTAALTINTSQNATFNSTGAIIIPVGTTAQRPTAASGQIRYNSIAMNQYVQQQNREQCAKNIKLYEMYVINSALKEQERYATADKSNKNDAEYMAKRITKEQYEMNKIKIGFVL